jgi:hypothetical protein
MSNFFDARNAKVVVEHYLYDLSLPLPERMHKRMLFSSGIAAAAFLGVSPQRVYMSRSNRHRIWSEAQGRWFAV